MTGLGEHSLARLAEEAFERRGEYPALCLEGRQVGEIVCRSPAVMRGYWRAPEATAEAVHVVTAVPLASVGKIDRKALRAQLSTPPPS